MGMKCRLLLVPGGECIEYEGMDGATYEEALLSIGIIPDTVLILIKGQSLPQDMQIEADVVEIGATGSRG